MNLKQWLRKNSKQQFASTMRMLILEGEIGADATEQEWDLRFQGCKDSPEQNPLQENQYD